VVSGQSSGRIQKSALSLSLSLCGGGLKIQNRHKTPRRSAVGRPHGEGTVDA
jgi:hypothetical protein